MKRYVYAFAAFLIVALLLTGCTEALFTTAEYRSFQSFADRHQAGTEKQTVFEELGYPDAYYDEQGNYQKVPYTEREAYEEVLLDEGAVFVYECYKRSDPAEPYRLKITFNDEGKSVGAELVLVPGG